MAPEERSHKTKLWAEMQAVGNGVVTECFFLRIRIDLTVFSPCREGRPIWAEPCSICRIAFEPQFALDIRKLPPGEQEGEYFCVWGFLPGIVQETGKAIDATW